ncbi:MAG: phosphatidylserine/phosphatidylglycerophosphate/cardiolipin synthase family protein [Mesorhizobium sp.]|nr:phosphatidylserine/phosphatidylglycerophosphate/cardiolipin synthase family protein [Mesorhizobium sp.]MCO5164467.1 phosphatidylserine/phosphatidylglycerophosphate/cardiolipin synthase family protein [Mesorhizobium sp.]
MTSIRRAVALLHALAATAVVATGCMTMGRIDTVEPLSAERAAGDPYLARLAQQMERGEVVRRGWTGGAAASDQTTVRSEADRGRSAREVSGSNTRLETTAAWRTSRETFYLAPRGNSSGDAPFAFSGLQARSVEIKLVPLDGAYFRLEFTCDGDLRVRSASGPSLHRAGRRVTLSPGVGAESWAQLTLLPSAGLRRCEGFAHYADGSRPFGFVRQETERPDLARFNGEYHRCILPRHVPDDPLANMFYASGWLSDTCPFPLHSPVLLASERAGFEAKVKALLGAGLPERFYAEGDPELPLDFSRAPRLSQIFISYLDIKADFSGRILDRLLRYHAARGTTIRILASQVLEREKDRAMLRRLAADFPNVSYKVHVWKPPLLSTPAVALSQFHRVNHAKLLAAISDDPVRSVAIIGGRNIHDGFLFDRPLDLSSNPSLQQYGQARGLTLNYYSNWRDLDLAVSDDTTVRLLTAHLSTLWEEDAVTRVVRPFSISERSDAYPREGFARHFLSVPYSDGRALEDYYVGLFEAARSRIDIVNPYLNLTERLRQALDRALERGVEVTIVGRISLKGDLGGTLMTAINEEFVERYFDRLKIYNYRDPKVLLHAKVLAIDGRLTVISGVNLNNRSFIHDTENGLVVLDRDFAARVAAVTDGFRRESDLVTEAPAESLFQLLLHVRMIREAL